MCNIHGEVGERKASDKPPLAFFRRSPANIFASLSDFRVFIEIDAIFL